MEKVVTEIKSWIYQAGEEIKKSFQEKLQVDTKSGPTDLVTNMDKATQDFLIEKIHNFDPHAKIMGEENGQDQLADFSGNVFIIDPIDGTMNFVLEQQNFCIMMAWYVDKVGKMGFVYNVMQDEFVYGGPEYGVFCNDKKLAPPKNKQLNEGLVGMNHVMFKKNLHNEQLIGDQALGVRMTGCAGYELNDLALGRRVAYISRLAPWDYAPGGIIIEALGLKISGISGSALQLNQRELVLAATPAAYEECLSLVKDNS